MFFDRQLRWLRLLISSLLLGCALLAQSTPATWATQADNLRGKNGQRFTFTIPGGGSLSGRLWGTNLYTDDSSIALAAVHAGLITPQSGGTVIVEIRPGAAAYQGTSRHGVTSKAYGNWHGSFVLIPLGNAAQPPAVPVSLNGSWSRGLVHIWQEGEKVLATATWKRASGIWVIWHGEGRLTGRNVTLSIRYSSMTDAVTGELRGIFTVSEDGNNISAHYTYNGRPYDDQVYYRDR